MTWARALWRGSGFNPRTPRGVRLYSIGSWSSGYWFQSTHPARGATVAGNVGFTLWDVSIHAPREGCDFRCVDVYLVMLVSIHAPREGCDGSLPFICCINCWFQSTHPARGATSTIMFSLSHFSVSIHAPREGCDEFIDAIEREPIGFNPRTPRGVRLVGLLALESSTEVSIHAPREGCDGYHNRTFAQRHVSIHAPREGCDRSLRAHFTSNASFNPRTPRGVRPGYLAQASSHTSVSIHAPREGCDS